MLANRQRFITALGVALFYSDTKFQSFNKVDTLRLTQSLERAY